MFRCSTWKIPKHSLVQACLNNWHHQLLHICIQKPYGQIIVMTSLMCCLYSCARHLFVSWDYDLRLMLFLGVQSLLYCLFCLFCFVSSVTLDEEQADWTVLASAVPSSCLKDNLYSR